MEKNLHTSFSMRELGKGDLEQFNALLRYAFQVTNQNLAKLGWQIDEIKQEKSPILDKAYVLGWFHKDKLASQIAVYPMHVNIQGKIYKMGGVTGVATYPEYSKKGLVKTLMENCLAYMRDQKQSISFLYPYSIPYYRRKGWEIISDKMTFNIKDTQLPKAVHTSGMIERVHLEHGDLKKVHNLFANQRHGVLVRDDIAWAEYWRWDTDDMTAAIYYDVTHNPTGYIIYYLENDIFNIKEMVYLNNEAHHGLWNYVSAHFSMVTEVRGANYTGEPLAFLLEDSEIKETIRPYFMARIVDFQQFISQYPFRTFPDNLAIVFEINDPILEWNCGNFVVCRDVCGKIICKHETDNDIKNRVSLNIQTLTTMLMGYKRPSYLHKIERLEATPDTINLLENIIPMGKPYFSDYF